MRNIPRKNYVILFLLIVVTIFITILLANMYTNNNKIKSKFYEYSNKITVDEFDGYLSENPDIIIYISDKYDLSNEVFESKFQSKIDNLNLKSKVIFIDKNEINNKFINKLKNNYKIDIELKNKPIIIAIIDKSVLSIKYVDEYSNVDDIIEYNKFE